MFRKGRLKSKGAFVLLAAIAVLLIFPAVLAASEPLIAVLPFEEGDLMWKGFRSAEILNGITQLVTDKLVQKEGIRVAERTRIYDILDEQDFGQSGRVDPATAAEIGRILGVDALVLGTVTRLEVADSGAISIGFLSVSGIKASVVLSGRVVDTTTAEILGSFKGEAEVEDASINITIKEMEGLTFGTKAFSNSVLGKCIEEATTNFVDSLDPAFLIKKPVEYLDGMVMLVVGDRLVIDIGSQQGVLKNQAGRLVRLFRVEGLSSPVEMPIGRVSVFSVDRNVSIVKIIEMEEGEEPFKGDVVQFEIIE